MNNKTLTQLNEAFLKKYKNDEKNLKKHIAIGHLLEDENCFKKLPIETSYSILLDLGFERKDLREIYLELVK